MFIDPTHQRKEQRFCRSLLAASCVQVKHSTVPHRTEASWKWDSPAMTLSQGCPGDCCHVLKSAKGLRACCWWPGQREGQGQEAWEGPVLCSVLIRANMLIRCSAFFGTSIFKKKWSSLLNGHSVKAALQGGVSELTGRDRQGQKQTQF